MRRFYFLSLSWFAALLFWGCPTTPSQNYNYLRSPLDFRVDTIPAIHPFCSQGQTPFTSVDSCVGTRKYALRWQRPEDTTGLLEYLIYLDTDATNPANSGKTWSQVRADTSLASAIALGAGAAFDSLLFVFNNIGVSNKEVQPGAPRILAFDTSDRIDLLGRLVFAIVAVYRQSASGNGEPGYTWIITNDRFPPSPLQTSFTPYDRRVEIRWNRPADLTSFFDPGADSGIIRRYVLRVVHGGILDANRPGLFAPQVQYLNGGADWSNRVRVDSFTTAGGVSGREFTLADSQHIFSTRLADPRDSLKVILSGLAPQDTVDISLWAVDLSNNATDSTIVTRVILTDTTEPLAPLLHLVPGSNTRNQFIYTFTASRDLVQRNGSLIPADSPNGNILQYHLIRRLISGSSGGSSSKDSILTMDATNRSDTLFTDTVRYLPPGSTYRIYAQAMDSTGHLSKLDSLDDSTLSIYFPGQDSAFTCPTGFVAIPAATFMLGDTTTGADPDERPYGNPTTHRSYIGSYCIETYEHRDSSGAFQRKVTWQQAESICNNLSPADSTHLCTEAEWERACEGPDSVPLTYGLQSEDPNNPNAVLNICNIGTGDSDMATMQSLRNPTCLTREGVFDMSGNLAEWVLDPYSASAYTAADTVLYPGRTLVPQVDTALHGFRGGYYLDSHLPTTTTLHSARCSNRDYPAQIRPIAYAGCVDSSQPLVVLLYNNASLPPRCLPIPPSLLGKKITEISPSRDSTTILFLIDGVATPVADTLPVSSVYAAYRPVTAMFTPLALVALTFENSQTGDAIQDTLDATEMTDTTDATLTAIFNREIAPPWSVRRENGHYAVHFLYAYAQLHNVPARRQYSNAAIGFRCCSSPRPPP